VTGHTSSVNIRDVARAAGVSHQTVSRVINGHPNVSPSTRRRVLQAIDSLGYRPNRAARALAGGPVDSVTVLTSNTRLYGQASALEGIEEATRAAGFALGVRLIEAAEPSAVSDAVKRAIEPSGAIIVIAFDKAGVATLDAVPPTVPTAALIPAPAEGEVVRQPSVWIDEYQASKDATNYLLRLGHRSVHHLSIPSWTGSTQRMSGWRSALQEAGAPVPRPLLDGWDADWGYEAGRKLAKRTDVTAVLCGNDDIAVGCIRAMHEAGRSVPEDVSIVGFDDVPLARFYSPALTTVRQDFSALGKVCFAKLLATFDPARALMQPLRLPKAKFIVRESAGPPPARARRRSVKPPRKPTPRSI